MTSTTERELDEHALVGTLTDPLRRIVGARVSDPHQVDDLVQESLLRVLGARDRITDDALLPYAVVVARNLAVSRARREATAQRNAPRLLQPNSVEGPEDAMLRAEEAQAVGVALRALPNRERDALIAHELHGVQTKTIASASSSTPGGVAAQLARARARMRVEYVVAIRGVDLPTAGCKPVLLALSMGDQRRQRALDAGAHLLTCGTCAELSEPLLTRKRVLTAIAPVG
ncbi:MAG: sigma-70 family RNA polymerase sigma factor, partial [Actinomycetota bacterium]|nr:sigma-70 family RNA polymerase sigma factor [Actinomycetota bacterium]